MKAMDKFRVIVSIVAAAGVFGICFVLYNNEALPLGIRIATAVLAVVNLICTILSCQEMVKKGKM